ncbi:MAG: glycoside hydrolase family 31 protein [Chitinophagales bacterium]|nr:glycoside hydrolase family 31 protein [Chitinophagales bacterium]
MKFAILLISFTSIFTIAEAQSLSQSLGNSNSSVKTENGIIIHTDNGNVKVIVYSANVIKIDITRNEQFSDFSYAVIANPESGVKYSMVENNDNYALETDSIKLIITKRPVRLALYNIEGKLINADDDAFGTSWIDNEITTYKKLFPSERFLGLGEKTGDLDRRGRGYENWNTDFFGYDSRNDPLYSTIPFYIGNHDSLVYGIFLDNSSKTHFNFGASQNRFSFFSTEAGDMNYFMICNSNVSKIIESYTWLTGRMPMPPLWSLGFQQCRYSYFPESEVLSLAQTFRDKKIPCDVIWFDIHYMQNYKVFTWDSIRFPNPKRMLDRMDKLGFKNIVIVDPGIKVEKNYAPYEDGLKNDAFIKYPDGTVYSGEVWPGWCVFTDFTKPSARIWWGKLFKENIDEGIDGVWCDMNEIATWGQLIPNNIVFNNDGISTTHKMDRNLYGFQMSRATYEGEKKLLSGKRPFVLTRAGYAGLQRYTAIWTGDNLPTDEHMLLGVRMVNSLGLSGVSFAGDDVSGFGGDATPQLYTRWMSVGAFCPFYRSHKMYGARDSEPWSYGEDMEQVVRSYVQLRYNLLPYIYSAFYESTVTGMPVQRSLAINYTNDEKIYQGNYENQYLFGSSLLVVPCPSSHFSEKVYLPAGEWYDFYNNMKYTGNNEMYYESPIEKLPVFVKAGSFIPMQSPVQTTVQLPSDTLFLHIYYSQNTSSFIYYEDAGDRFDYENGVFVKRNMVFDPLKHQIVLDKVQGSYSSQFKNLKLIFHGFQEMKNTVKINGTETGVKTGNFPMMEVNIKDKPLLNTLSAVIKNKNDQILIQW